MNEHELTFSTHINEKSVHQFQPVYWDGKMTVTLGHVARLYFHFSTHIFSQKGLEPKRKIIIFKLHLIILDNDFKTSFNLQSIHQLFINIFPCLQQFTADLTSRKA